jgi:hypothetical protein
MFCEKIPNALRKMIQSYAKPILQKRTFMICFVFSKTCPNLQVDEWQKLAQSGHLDSKDH